MTVVSTSSHLDSILSCFHALSDPIRLEVIESLRHQELCVCEIGDRLNLKQSKLSFHLKILKDAGLIMAKQEGRWIYYRLNLSKFTEIEQYLGEYRRLSPILPARLCDRV